MKIPEDDETIQRIWRWVSQQYARSLLGFVDEPRISSNKEYEGVVETLGDWSHAVEEATYKAPWAHNFEHERRIVNDIFVDMSEQRVHWIPERQELTIFYPNRQYSYSKFPIKLKPNRQGSMSNEAGRKVWFFEFRGKEYNGTLEESLERLKKVVQHSHDTVGAMTDDDLVDFHIMKRHIEKEAGEEGPIDVSDEPAWNTFRIDSTKWKEYGVPAESAPNMVAVTFGPETSSYAGYWRSGNTGVLAVLMSEEHLTPSSHNDYLKHRDRLKEITEHEVRHMIQTLASRAKGLKEDSMGLPPLSMRSTKYNPSGAYVKTKEPYPRQEHALRDIEFHTRLGDEVRGFKKVLSQYPRNTWVGVFKAWVGATKPFQAHSFADRTSGGMPYTPMVFASHFFEMLKEHQPAKWREAVKQLANATIGQAADDAFADDSPSQWKSTDPFHFLPNQKDPPKGYFPMGTEQHGEPGPIKALDIPHVPLLEKEFEALSEYARHLSLPGAIRMALGRPYIPLQVKIRSTEQPYEHESVMPIGKLLRMLKAEVVRTKKITRNRKGFAPSQNATALRNLAGVERHIDRVQARLQRMSSPKAASRYRYDAAPQKSEARFWLEELEAGWFRAAAEEIGFPNAVVHIRPDSGDLVGEDMYYLPSLLKDARGRLMRLGKVLRRMSKNSEHIAQALETKYRMSQGQMDMLLEDMSKRFAEAPKASNWTLVVSAEPADILSMSTGRGWQSCITEGRENYNLLDGAISAWDMVAYAVDKDTDNWLSRAWLRNDGTGKWWPEDQVYQTGKLDEGEFLKAVEKYLTDKGIMGTAGQYHPQAKGWSDRLGHGIIQSLSPEELERLRGEAAPEPYSQWEGWEESDIGKGQTMRPGAIKMRLQTYRFTLTSGMADEEEIDALMADVKRIAGPEAVTHERFDYQNFRSFLATVPESSIKALLQLDQILKAVPAQNPQTGIWSVEIAPIVPKQVTDEHGVTQDDVYEFSNGRLSDSYKTFHLEDIFLDAWMDLYDKLRQANVPFVQEDIGRPYNKRNVEMGESGLQILRKLPYVVWLQPQQEEQMSADLPLSSRDRQYERDSRYLVSLTGPRERRLDLLDSIRLSKPHVAVLDAESMTQGAVDDFLDKHECCPMVVSVGDKEKVPAKKSFDLSGGDLEDIEKELLGYLAEPDFVLIMST